MARKIKTPYIPSPIYMMNMDKSFIDKLYECSEKFSAKMADECHIERYLWKGTKEYKERFGKENGKTNKKILWLVKSKIKQSPILLTNLEKFTKKRVFRVIQLLGRMIT